MTKAKISEYDAVASNNTDVNGVNIAEGCPPSGMNNMGREIMAALKRFQVGSDGDGVTVGGNLVVSGSSTVNTFTAGQSVISVDSTSDALRITQVGTGNALVVEDEANPDSTPVVIDADGDVVLGSTSRRADFIDGTRGGKFTLESQGTTGAAVDASAISQIVNSSTSSASPIYRFGRSKNNALGSTTIVASGDHLGQIQFYGADGTNLIQAASIRSEVDGTPGTNDMPGRLLFSTTADGGSSPTERMRITSGGYVRLSSNALGIQFGGDTAAANALDDYEEGTFTPGLVGTTTAGSATYSVQDGRYTKIGNVVTFSITIAITGKGGAVGSIRINNLPFPALSGTPNTAISVGNVGGASITAGQAIQARVPNNTTFAVLFLTDASGGNTNLADTEITDTFTVDVAGSYFVS